MTCLTEQRNVGLTSTIHSRMVELSRLCIMLIYSTGKPRCIWGHVLNSSFSETRTYCFTVVAADNTDNIKVSLLFFALFGVNNLNNLNGKIIYFFQIRI